MDDLSEGRLILGLGAGWQEREHNNYGFDLLPKRERFDRFEEGVEVITNLLRSDEPVDYDGQYYRLEEGILLPRPQRPEGPPILIGGNGLTRTLPLTARYAKEWNALMTTAERFTELNEQLDNLITSQGRELNEVRRSMMVGCIFGKDENQLQDRVTQRTGGKLTIDELISQGRIVSTPTMMVDQLSQLAEAGVQRVMLQWIDLDDLEGLEAIAKHVLPQLSA